MSMKTCVSMMVVLLAAQNGSVSVDGCGTTSQWSPSSSEPATRREPAPAGLRPTDGRSATVRPRAENDLVRKVREPAESEPVVTRPIVASPTPQPGDTVVDLGNGIRFELAFIPAGEFRMGSNDGQADEFPVRRVVIRRGFLIGKYEVTQAQWMAVMGANPSSFTGDETLPVERVSWEDCQEFVRRLNDMTGGGWRLPTEAEWEYACRAGTDSEYGGDLEQLGWHRENGGLRPHPVGSKRPNRWGLYDTHGNVWEWCEDWYDPSSYGKTNGTERVGPRSGVFRVSRGGSWYDDAKLSRSANRNGTKPTARSVSLGLRLVRSF